MVALRKNGYLANIFNLPPLIFKFQFNPEILQEKKTFNYREANSFGKWEFDKTAASSGAGGALFGFLDDLKEVGSLLVGTKPLEAEAGSPRVFTLDFALDATERTSAEPDPNLPPPDPLLVPGDVRAGGRIEPDLAVLRSFINPTFDPIEIVSALATGRAYCPLSKPPICTLKLGDVDLDCVMTDLSIKVTQFKPDMTPLRAEVSTTLKEQTFSYSTSLDFLGRYVEVVKSYWHLEGEDWVQALPATGLIQTVFSI
jgi:hypothetical protein